MEHEKLLHGIFVAVVISMFALRLYYHGRAQTYRKGKTQHPDGLVVNVIRWIFALPLMAAFFASLFRPEWLSWARLPLPEWLRWFGLGLALLSLVLLAWIHWALAKNFSTVLRIR